MLGIIENYLKYGFGCIEGVEVEVGGGEGCLDVFNVYILFNIFYECSVTYIHTSTLT